MGDFFGGGAQRQQGQDIGQETGVLQHYFDQGQQALNPYMQAGAGALPQYSDFLSQIGGDMGGQWMKDYKESPQAKYLTDQELEAANTGAAASGMLGSGGNIKGDMGIASKISSGDMQNYFNNMMRQRGMYMQGLGGLTGMGMGAAGKYAGMAQGMGQDVASLMEEQAKARAEAEQSERKGKGGLAGEIIGAGGDYLKGPFS